MEQVIFSGERNFEIINLPKPDVGNEQALIRTVVSGVSAGTEGMWWNATATALKTGRKSYPYYPGYELVGEVVEVGKNFQGLEVGDRVFAMKPHASYATVTEKDVWFKLPKHVSNESALAIALTGTSLHAIHRSGITVGDSCAVVGLGVLGLNLIQILSKAMACDVLAVTDSKSKQNLGIELGARESLSAEEAISCFGIEGVYASFDCSGVNSCLDTAVRLTGDQGVVVGAGFYTEPMKIDGERVFSKELRVVGVRATGVVENNNPFNRWDRDRTMQLAFDLVSKGLVNNESIVTHSVSYKNAAELYNMIVDKTEPYLQTMIHWNSN